MATKLLAPSLGEGVEELTVINWLKKEGDAVKEMESIVELETDKVTTEIPSPVAGTLLKILAPKDSAIKVGAILAWIGQPGEALESTAPPAPAAVQVPAAGKEPAAPQASAVKETPAAAPMPAAVPATVPLQAPAPVAQPAGPVSTEFQGHVSPLAKKIASMNQVDLSLVKGTGQGGRVTKDDILNYVEARKTAGPASAAQPHAGPAAPVASTPAHAPVSAPGPMALAGTLTPVSSVRRQIAERMVYSMQTSPHVLTVMEADLSKILAHRAVNKAAFAEQGINLTLTAYFCAAVVTGLKACPYVNSSWTDQGIQRYDPINLGIATALGDAGLIVPVIKDAGSLSLQGLAQKLNDLTGRARTKKLIPEDVKDATFTLTNHGLAGSLFASPIISQPQAAILGTGLMQKRPIVITDESGSDSIAIRPMIYLSLVFDHRILDGESADRFLREVKKALEEWC